ncbi:MAG: nickel-responsive transcriptional regulator NikR [Kiritimatiellae bacterium]|nr:nickel-responsive transcriptional regulator NikR [Kiritimatiellia bacterium]
MGVVRFTVSLERELVERFDRKIRLEQYPTRSKAVGDLIRASLVRTEWSENEEVAGAIVLVYDHHRRDLVRRLIEIQHDYDDAIISAQHVHLDDANCLEIIAVRGRAARIQMVFRKLKTVKGMKHISLAAGTTGAHLP